jgi:hypothetical protein
MEDNLRKVIVILAILCFLLEVEIGQETVIPMLTQSQFAKLGSTVPKVPDETVFAEKLQKMNDTIMLTGFIVSGVAAGVIGGYLIEEAIWWRPITTVTPGSSVWIETGPTSGKWITTPGSTSTAYGDTSPNGILTNTWVSVGDAAIGAALSFGIYELGHKILHWW